jgi:hypothetical protein
MILAILSRVREYERNSNRGMVMNKKRSIPTTIGMLTLAASSFVSAQCPAVRSFLATSPLDLNTIACPSERYQSDAVSTDNWRSQDFRATVSVRSKAYLNGNAHLNRRPGLMLFRFGERTEISVDHRGIKIRRNLGR